ncbi:MAG TPA: LacI family DNA-binding transcriptional regulator [Spirochaetia bacterium]|nr:LacI family DNA-binding transcriptional regulator [Spirochaetia bacterium]
MKQPTQKEVAQKAGVSRATVSYVLNDKSSEGVPISDETRRKVLEAVEDLGYRPNAQARTLRSGRTMTIGVLMLDLHNPHFWQHLSGIEAEAHLHGYTIMVFHTALKRSEENVALRELTQKRIDGAIINASYGVQIHDEESALALGGMPIVDLSSQDSPFDHITADYRAATRELMSHLFDLGHRRFGMVYGIANPDNGLDRLESYQESLSAHGLTSENGQVITCGPTQEEGYEAALQLLRQEPRPTAIIAINDYLAMSVMRAAADLGISVPGELSVCGFDDIPFSQFMVPRLTTVRRETELGGRRAFQLLLDRMNGYIGPARVEWIGASLQIRESTGPLE